MPLPAGSRLGPYEILSAIGAGGMGEVYRARDTKLGRDVAIKILPSAVTFDADRLGRFEREARLLASLNHPNIGAIYGVDEANGQRFLVLELVDGESLDRRVARGAIPVDEVLDIARQIAEALEAAHEKGIVHRDLKPANIAVTASGIVKVLDFGLAKAMDAAGGADWAGELGHSPTITSPAMMTGIGTILGTASYMSPEQAKGRAADKRSDVWAFGCVVYEMLTGRRAFEGEDVGETLANILKSEPAWEALPADTPRTCRTLLARCLQKDRARRIATISVVQFLLADSLDDTNAVIAPVKSARRGALVAVILTIALVALVMVVVLSPRRPSADIRAVNADIAPPPRTKFQPMTGGSRTTALSPTGSSMAFRALSEGGDTQLWIRNLTSGLVRPVRDSSDPVNPFWSPDGRQVGFFGRDGTLRIAGVDGGATRIIARTSAAPARGATWNHQGVILFAASQPGTGIFRTSLDSNPVAITKPDPAKHELFHRWPVFLPDGRRFLFLVRHERNEEDSLHLGSLDGGAPVRLLPLSSVFAYSNAGYLLFVRERSLYAQRFDVERALMTGEPMLLAEGVLTDQPSASAEFSLSDEGALAYFTTTEENRLVWQDRNGVIETLPIGAYVGQATGELSRRGDAILSEQVDPREGKRQIWNIDVARSIQSVVASVPLSNIGPRILSPIWSPDGTAFVMHGYRGSRHVLIERKMGTSTEDILLDSDVAVRPTDWSADGRTILYQRAIEPAGGRPDWEMCALDLPGRQSTRMMAHAQDARLSPDGRLIAFVSQTAGPSQIFVAETGTSGRQWQASSNGGTVPRWRADGRELFYLGSDRRIHAVEVARSPVRISAPMPLSIEVLNDGGYSVSPDGRRFLFARNAADSANAMRLVLNWPALLKH
jgi:serine/threonine protein kinase